MKIEELDALTMPWPEGNVASGLPMACVGLRMTFYFQNGYSAELRRELVAIVDEYLAMADGRIRAYQRAGDRRRLSASARKPVDLGRLRERVEDFKTSWGLEMSAEPEISAASLWSMQSVASEDGYLLLHFPVSAFVGKEPHGFRNRFQKWCSALNVQHAYAGLGFALPVGGDDMAAAIKYCAPYATRLVGLDLDYPITVAYRCHGGIRTVNWLTAIDDARMKQVGGAESVMYRAGPNVQAVDYSQGKIFVAGEAPQIGDAEAGNFPTAYADLGRVVASLRSDIPEAWFKTPEGYQAPPRFTAKSGWRDARPDELPGLHYTKVWQARFD